MRFSLFKSLIATTVLALVAGCGSSSSNNAVTSASSAWVGITVDDVTTPSKLYLANFGTNVIGSVPIAGGTFTSMTNTSAAFSGPEGVVLVGANLFVVDSLNHAIRQVSTTTPYTTTTLAGVVGSSGNSETSTTYPKGLFKMPRNAVADAAGNTLYVTDAGNNTVRKITLTNPPVVSTLASGFNNPWGITIDNAMPPNLYVTDIGTNSVKRVTMDGSVSTIAGDIAGKSGLPTNANGTAAFFNYPLGITTDGTSLFVVDQGNNAIRSIDLAPPHAVTLIAGSSAGTAGSTVNVSGASAMFSLPYAIAYGNGFLYVSDQNGTLIRKVSTTTPYEVTAFTLN